eukprot:CAMPEP_0113820282 /NCGR_PEP_ID=MMETSP0328-20130328/1162_1 /TAXON_ID=39455 /ORGANISM="Alexandrium minutum" /LENGTH=302 /DNA_ID=CAMNT_0000788217 /DNA_START=93 /DNA_END=998 /DNA_ORIENTATION=+ /assembly_acc=CAM_ASM_000350
MGLAVPSLLLIALAVWLRTVAVVDLHAILKADFAKKSKSDRTPATLVLGAGDSAHDVVEFAYIVIEAHARLILVEPNPYSVARLQNILSGREYANVSCTVLQAVVGSADADNASAVLYVMSPRVLEKWPHLNMTILHWGSSIDYSLWLEAHWGGQWVMNLRGRHKDGVVLSPDDWGSLVSYMEEIRIPSLAPAQIVASAGAAVADVSFLVMDIEGAEISVVPTLFASGLLPAVVKLDVHCWKGNVSNNSGAMLAVLADLDYRFIRGNDNGTHLVWAVQASALNPLQRLLNHPWLPSAAADPC